MTLDDNRKPITKLVNGYYDTFIDKRGIELIFCFHKNDRGDWTISEKSSGLKICGGYSSRNSAIEELKSKFIDLVFPLLQNEYYNKYKKQIMQVYEDRKFNSSEIIL